MASVCRGCPAVPGLVGRAGACLGLDQHRAIRPSQAAGEPAPELFPLLWLLQGRRVVALSGDTAALQNPSTGNVLTYRKARKPAYGPLGDSLDDFTA